MECNNNITIKDGYVVRSQQISPYCGITIVTATSKLNWALYWPDLEEHFILSVIDAHLRPKGQVHSPLPQNCSAWNSEVGSHCEVVCSDEYSFTTHYRIVLCTISALYTILQILKMLLILSWSLSSSANFVLFHRSIHPIFKRRQWHNHGAKAKAHAVFEWHGTGWFQNNSWW